jgi:hypothetical protein
MVGAGIFLLPQTFTLPAGVMFILLAAQHARHCTDRRKE